MKTLIYNVMVHQDDQGRWIAGCEEPMLPGINGETKELALWNVYDVIFDDLRKKNQSAPFSGSFELRVNIIEF